jgi:hypothetical protein
LTSLPNMRTDVASLAIYDLIAYIRSVVPHLDVTP